MMELLEILIDFGGILFALLQHTLDASTCLDEYLGIKIHACKYR